MRRTGRILILALLSAGMAPSSKAIAATCTVPNSIANGQVADAAKIMGNFNAVANCAQAAITPTGTPKTGSLATMSGSTTVASGDLSGDVKTSGSTITTLSNSGVTAGSYTSANIIVDAKGRITSASNGSGGSGNSVQREFGQYAPPDASTFTVIDSPQGITPTVTNVLNIGTVYSVPVTVNQAAFPGAYQALPASGTWTVTMRAKVANLFGSYPEFGIWIKDSAGKMIGEVVENNGGLTLIAKRCDSNVAQNSVPYVKGINEAPTWFRIKYDGTSLMFYVSWDSQNWIYYYSESSSSFLNGSLKYVGVGGLTGISDTSLYKAGSTMGGVITYWSVQ